MAYGIRPPKLLPFRLKWVRFGNKGKSKKDSDPIMCILERSILETVLVLEQEMAVQLQRLLRLVMDHELSSQGVDDDDGEEDKPSFHLTSDSVLKINTSPLRSVGTKELDWSSSNMHGFL
ncbi:hypothetical protein ACFX1R_033544 [Malus domestica]